MGGAASTAIIDNFFVWEAKKTTIAVFVSNMRKKMGGGWGKAKDRRT
jgi:hypothetical protein